MATALLRARCEAKTGCQGARGHDVPGGFCWQEQVFASLSTIARKITRTSWNGPRFFGLRGGRRGGSRAYSVGRLTVCLAQSADMQAPIAVALRFSRLPCLFSHQRCGHPALLPVMHAVGAGHRHPNKPGYQ